MPSSLTPFRSLPEAQQDVLRETWAEEAARDTCGRPIEEKVARFAAWLAPQGIGFTFEDLPPHDV